jgi:hypothetical protein
MQESKKYWRIKGQRKPINKVLSKYRITELHRIETAYNYPYDLKISVVWFRLKIVYKENLQSERDAHLAAAVEHSICLGIQRVTN